MDKSMWIAQKAWNSARVIKSSDEFKSLSADAQFYIQCMIDHIEHTTNTKL